MPAPTFTYEYDYSTARDRIRLLISDTDEADKLLYDQEIARYVSADGDDQNEAADYLSASKAATAISLKFARQVNAISSGDDSITYGSANDRATFFRTLSATLLTQGRLTVAPRPFVGGSSSSDKASREDDTDRVQPFFGRGANTSFTSTERYGDWS